MAAAAPAGVVAIKTAKWLGRTQAYAELVPGLPAWSDLGKSRDYALLLALLVGYLACLLALGGMSLWIRRRCGRSVEQAYRELLAYGSIPAVLWFAGMALTTYRSIYSLYLASLLIALVVRNAYCAVRSLTVAAEVECVQSVGAVIVSRDGRGTARSEPTTREQFLDRVGAATLIPMMAAFGAFSAVLGLTHLGFEITPRRLVIAGVPALLGWMATERNWRRIADSGTRVVRLRWLLVVAQAPLPLLFLTVLPVHLASDGRVAWDPAVQRIFPVAVAAFMAAAFLDVGRRLWRRGSGSRSALAAVSPFALIALVLLLKPVALLLGDNYHISEFLLPWWLTHEFGYIPFWDYMPARGLMNYLPGLLATVLMDGTASSQSAVMPALQLAYLSAGLLVIARCLGLVPAFLMSLLMASANLTAEIDVVLTAALCVACERFGRSAPSRWLALWMVLCAGLVLFAPAAGGMWAIATAPLAAAAVYRLATGGRRRDWIGPAVVLGAGAALAAATPLGKMLVGAVRYVAEQSSVNSVAYGIPWVSSWNAPGVRNGMLFELVRCSFLIVGVIAGLVLLQGLARRETMRGRRALLYAVPIGILMVLIIPKVAGRIDPGVVQTRLGRASIWSLAMLLPALLWATWPKRRHARAAVIAAAAAGVLGPVFGMNDLKAMLTYRSVPAIPLDPRIDSRASGLPNLGRYRLPDAELSRLQSLKATIERYVRPGETYVDLTNNNARHFYLGYPPPIEAAIYNLPTEAQQLRAVRRLHAADVPLAIVSADNLAFDRALASLRTHLIYRDLVMRYQPIMAHDCIFLVDPSRLGGRTVSLSPENWTDANWVNGIFRHGRAGFFTSSPAGIPGVLRPGHKLVFASSGPRRIEAVEGINVWLTGGPLDAQRDGYPHQVAVPNMEMDRERKLLLLDMAFRQADLLRLPRAWGRSFETLAPRLRPVARLGEGLPMALKEMVATAPGTYQITGLDPGMTFDLSQLGLSGADAGILVFDLQCDDPDSEPLVEVFWSGDDVPLSPQTMVTCVGGSGRFVVPLDAAPRWLLCQRIQTLRIDVGGSMNGAAAPQSVSIRNIELFQRRAVDDLP